MSSSPHTMLGHSFSDLSLLTAALTHPSHLNEFPGSADYQRLEFLGDAVLGMVLADLLYNRFQGLSEGDLSRLRASLADQPRLAELADGTGIAPCILLGRGEQQDSGSRKPSILADVLEAVIGAIYLDAGFQTAKDVVERLYGKLLDDPGLALSLNDPKSRLQEWLAANRHVPPVYRLVSEDGPPHDRSFTISVSVGDKVWGTGTGRSKKTAQQDAALAALERVQQLQCAP